MLSQGKKRKISHNDWPAIAARYHDGEALASIARSFGCTPPAIRYIVTQVAKAESLDRAPPESALRQAETMPVATPAGNAARPVRQPAAPRRRSRRAPNPIDHTLRTRVNSDISAFVVAFEGAIDDPTPVTRQQLINATDRLLRACARTRIALEQMERAARTDLPLPTPNGTPQRRSD